MAPAAWMRHRSISQLRETAGAATRFAPDSSLEGDGFEPSVPRQGTAFFTEGNELYPLPN
jgi:hypothetical protein